MTDEQGIAELLGRELAVVRAPDFLWGRVEAAIRKPRPRPVMRWALIMAAVALVALYAGLSFRRAGDTLDLGPYLASAVAGAPPHFAEASANAAPAQLDGYRVSAHRVMPLKNSHVDQIVYDGSESPVALFVAPSRVQISYGREKSHEDNIDGIACRRIEGARQRALQFHCAAETCVLVCKTCSENLMASLMRQLSEGLGGKF